MGPSLAAVCLAGALLLGAPRAVAGPDPAGATVALLRSPLDVAGDLFGAVGLWTASVVGLAGDGVALVDANRLTRPLLRGFASRTVHAVAWGISAGGTGALEILRHEDLERLPQTRAAYLDAAPGVGRLDTALGGFSALGLAWRDAFTGPAVGVLRATGAGEWADDVQVYRREARIRALGPEPLPAD